MAEKGLAEITAEGLRRNLETVLSELERNRYQDQPPAKLIAVTKNVSAEVTNMLPPLGQIDIGESRVQAALEKLPRIDPSLRLHWIGRLQSNKVKYIADQITLLHTLDRESLAQEADRRAGERGRILPALVQVNIAREPQKGGLAPEELRPFLHMMKGYPHLQVVGLMSIMPIDADEETLTALFRGMRSLFEQIREEAPAGVEMRELSMGMSRDYRIAAREGATMVRIGTALYR